ncbi:unnamed protein product, partial [Heterosigma akashiwo]
YRLIQIPGSHFCEKAQWGLELKRLKFEDVILPPGLHFPVVKMLGVPATTTPVLVRNACTAIQGSQAILMYLDEQYPNTNVLYPPPQNLAAEVVRWENLFDSELGPATRALVYSHALYHGSVITDLWNLRTTATQRFLLNWIGLKHLVKFSMWRWFELGEEQAERSMLRIDEVVRRVEAQLCRTGSGYLCGHGFTAADVAFAALLGPLVVAEEDGYWHPVPQIKQYPEKLQDYIFRLRQTKAAEYAKRMYHEHRRV